MVHEVCCTFFKMLSNIFEAEFLTSVKNKMLWLIPATPQTRCAALCNAVQAPRVAVQVSLHLSQSGNLLGSD